MTSGHNILNRLQEYEILPPAGMKEQILSRIGSLSASSGNEGRNSLAALGQFGVQPPAALRQAIERRILSGSEKTSQLNDSGMLRRPLLVYLSGAIAACFLLALSIYAFHRSGLTPSTQPVAITSSTSEKMQPAKDGVTGTGKDSLEKAGQENLDTADAGPLVKTVSPATEQHSFQVSGSSYAVQDNDLMATFTGFHYGRIPAFLTGDDEKELTVHIDQFASVRISRDMRDMMRKMYQYKSSGELTRKAKRMRARLNEWKTMDEAHFDQKSGFNPIDPVDLGEFIFK